MLCASDASAYLDPNAGGALFQILLPVVAAIVGWWTLLKGKLKLWMTRLVGRIKNESPPENI
jgi:hypothetical protein